MQSLSRYLWLNKQSLRLTIYSNTAVYGEKWVKKKDKSSHLSIFTSLKHLMVLLRCNFFRASFYTLSKTLIACRTMQLRFCKVKTWLHNAFKLVFCTLVFHFLPSASLSLASRLCLSSRKCLASVAASMSCVFRFVVTSFHNLKRSKRMKASCFCF